METIACNRRSPDRRRPLPFLSKYQLGVTGRRLNSRRVSDGHTYVDHYDLPVILVAIGIVMMSALDAAFTLKLLSLGAIELNAVMATLINENTHVFVSYKLALTALAVLLLVIHKNVRLSIGVTVNRLAQVVFSVYVLLITYELALFRIILG